MRWRRPTSETNKIVRSGENLAPTFMNDFPQPGALPLVVNGQVVREGTTLAPGLRLESIGRQSAIFSIRGQRFEMKL